MPIGIAGGKIPVFSRKYDTASDNCMYVAKDKSRFSSKLILSSDFSLPLSRISSSFVFATFSKYYYTFSKITSNGKMKL